MSVVSYPPMIKGAAVCTADNEIRGMTASLADVTDLLSTMADNVIRSASPIIFSRSECEQQQLGPLDADACLAIPSYVGTELRCVSFLFLDCGDQAQGAVEIWSRDSREELRLNGGAFSGLSRFANISQFVRFPKGSGLPGICWQDREVKMITGIGHSPHFMRAAGARAAGLNVGIAIPVMISEHVLNAVVLFLSSRTTPLATRIDIWDIDADHSATVRRHGSEMNHDCEPNESSLIEKVVHQQTSIIHDDLASAAEEISQGTSPANCWSMGIPIFVGEHLKSVVVINNTM